ncbi:ARF-GAP domain 15 [Striga asiatica]|uniref:ARF-GAP domain 15 n=1 Tax=Striga asiatica TaxID=4170 RepID=A0A5A7Q0S8_STRAF|nr:ARF-GAP domain 15 [Striga asiatica]
MPFVFFNFPSLLLSLLLLLRFVCVSCVSETICYRQKEAMNGKASVSKELNAKHAKILEGLLKLPKNRECADCRSKAPRWASINLGIFICMQCSGIHRSLGVHISKVRSTTLDTWLPEQISFMQMMGNEKSNEYWEAELPPDFDRNPIENFIRAKYADKRWASRTSPEPGLVVNQEKKITAGTSSRRDIPKKARKYSLDEEFFANEMPQPVPITRNRGSSLDLMTDIIPGPPNTGNNGESRKSVDTATDLFSLLYVSEAKQDRTVVPPSRWATFECKDYIYINEQNYKWSINITSLTKNTSLHWHTLCGYVGILYYTKALYQSPDMKASSAGGHEKNV